MYRQKHSLESSISLSLTRLQETIAKLAAVVAQNHQAFAETIINIEAFGFESRKKIESIINDLYNNAPKEMVNAFSPNKEKIANEMLEKYPK